MNTQEKQWRPTPHDQSKTWSDIARAERTLKYCDCGTPFHKYWHGKEKWRMDYPAMEVCGPCYFKHEADMGDDWLNRNED